MFDIRKHWIDSAKPEYLLSARLKEKKKKNCGRTKKKIFFLFAIRRSDG